MFRSSGIDLRQIYNQSQDISYRNEGSLLADRSSILPTDPGRQSGLLRKLLKDESERLGGSRAISVRKGRGSTEGYLFIRGSGTGGELTSTDKEALKNLGLVRNGQSMVKIKPSESKQVLGVAVEKSATQSNTWQDRLRLQDYLHRFQSSHLKL